MTGSCKPWSHKGKWHSFHEECCFQSGFLLLSGGEKYRETVKNTTSGSWSDLLSLTLSNQLNENHKFSWILSEKKRLQLPRWADTTPANPDRTEPPAADTSGHWQRRITWSKDFTVKLRNEATQVSESQQLQFLPAQLVVRKPPRVVNGDVRRRRRILRGQTGGVKRYLFVCLVIFYSFLSASIKSNVLREKFNYSGDLKTFTFRRNQWEKHWNMKADVKTQGGFWCVITLLTIIRSDVYLLIFYDTLWNLITVSPEGSGWFQSTDRGWERTCWSRVKVRVSRTNWETASSAVDGYRTRLTSQPLEDTTHQHLQQVWVCRGSEAENMWIQWAKHHSAAQSVSSFKSFRFYSQCWFDEGLFTPQRTAATDVELLKTTPSSGDHRAVVNCFNESRSCSTKLWGRGELLWPDSEFQHLLLSQNSEYAF